MSRECRFCLSRLGQREKPSTHGLCEDCYAGSYQPYFWEVVRLRELERRVQTFEHPDGTFVHWLLLSIPSSSPDPGEAIDEFLAKRKGR